MNLQATQAHAQGEPQPRGGAMKFTYPGGSRPLDGYTIKRGIGRGGFGEVYYATSDGGKEVALKLIRRNLDVELRGVTQCLNLKHPNLLGLFDVRQDDLGDSWVVMEYIAGENLEEVISRHPQGLPLADALAWFKGIAAGVAYLHDRGIVHRDLKPGNIFCDEGLVKIGDYGLTKFISASRRSGQTESVGTVHYMAPEIGNGRYGKEIDIYALGIVLYEILSGRVPFDGESVGEVLMKHLTAEPDLGEVAEPYRSAIARALVKDPERRMQSVAELLSMIGLATGSAADSVAAFQPSRTAAPSAPGTPPVMPVAPSVPLAAVEVVDEEPLARGVRRAVSALAREWDRAQVGGRLAFIVVGGLLALKFGIFFMAAAPFMAIGYLIYYGIWSATRPKRATPVMALRPAPIRAPRYEPPPAAARAQAPCYAPVRPARHVRRNGYAERLAAMPPKGARQRLEELIGSLLVSPVVVAALCAVMMILRGHPIQSEQFAWFTLIGATGAWLVMVPSKFWEGRSGDPVLRRFVLMSLGLLLGTAAYYGQSLLMVDLAYEWHQPPRISLPVISSGFAGVDGAPTMLGHLAYFTLLLVVPRWWRQSDPARTSRFSLWMTGMTGLWAWLVSFFWPYPQPWGVMLACAMSIAVQIASPWQERTRAAQGVAA